MAKYMEKSNRKDKFRMIGECGLDYDRLEFAGKEMQLKVFKKHFELSEMFDLPMYFHSRAAELDFLDVIEENKSRYPGGVVHSFTGTQNELDEILKLGLYVGVNGCSLKTEENCKNVKKIPMDRLLLESDCPYCEIRPKSAAAKFVKTKFKKVKKIKYNPKKDKLVNDRNEPCKIV